MAKSEASVGGLRDEEVEGRDWERVQPRRQMRGGRESESTTRTTFWRGNYESNPQLREEFLNIARTRGNGHLS